MTNTRPFHGYVWESANLPNAVHAVSQRYALREDALRITATRAARVFFRDMYAPPKHLPSLIRSAVQEGAEKKVSLVVDSRARYVDAAAVVDEIGKAGIREICILARKRQE